MLEAGGSALASPMLPDAPEFGAEVDRLQQQAACALHETMCLSQRCASAPPPSAQGPLPIDSIIRQVVSANRTCQQRCGCKPVFAPCL